MSLLGIFGSLIGISRMVAIALKAANSLTPVHMYSLRIIALSLFNRTRDGINRVPYSTSKEYGVVFG